MDTSRTEKAPAAQPDEGRVLTWTVDDDGVALVVYDVPGEAQNTLNPRFAREFDEVLSRLETDPAIRAVVFASGKPESFLAGADAAFLRSVDSRDKAVELSRGLQRALDRLERLPKPVVAAIRGACLGGGLELAMACHARVAADDKKTVLGQPEVMLGLIPGGGGTQRLPRLVGLAEALDLILTGKQVKARKAHQLGLVDEVVPPAIVREAARRIALERVGEATREGVAVRRARAPLKERAQKLALEENALGRKLVFKKARESVLAKTGGHYPAPLRALEAIQAGFEEGRTRGYEVEAEKFADCVVDPVAKNLIGLFFAQTELKKDNGTGDPSVKARPVRKVFVLGGGLMGGGIAYVTAAIAGIDTRIKEKDDAGVARGLSYVRGIVDERVGRKSLTPLEAAEILGRLSATVDYSGLANADLVVEAVFEDLELKRRVLGDVEAVTRADCVFASNTSTIPIAQIAAVSKRPETVCGMHYFSPVHKMPLLEVIVTDKTAPWVAATAVALGKKQGKTVIVVNDGPGFYTSRILGPYMNEAAHLLTEGVPIEAIDRALVRWGFPVGPITLLDEVGIDVAEKAGKVMHAAFADRMTPPAVIGRLTADGRAGRKNKKGFYTYDGKEKRPDESVYRLLGVTPSRRPPPAEELAERVALQMVNEAARCLGEGIVRSPRDGDVGAIFGLGFPAFRGGPFRWVDSVGAAAVVAKLDTLAARHGARFEAAPLLREHGRSGKRFYPA